MLDDTELLRRYAEENAQDALAELVRRRIDFVYAAALRVTGGNAHLAQDVTQTVFTDLAAKAGALARHVALTGWLHTATRFAAAKAIRAECRHQKRQQEAYLMQEILGDTAPSADWARVQPVVDEVLGELKEREREAVLLRFFEGKGFLEIATKLALTETAARSCVDRALEKMSAQLARRGVRSTTAALSLALANQAALAAPAGLATTVTSAALAGVSGGGVAAAWLTFLTMNKIKTGIVVALFVAALVPPLVGLRGSQQLKAELATLRTEGAAAQADSVRLRATVENSGVKNVGRKEADDIVRWRARAAQLKARPDGVVDAAMKPPANAGWATPAASLETMTWALWSGDWEVLAQGVVLAGDTKAATEAFFAGLSPAAQTRFGSPERLLAYGWVNSAAPASRDTITAMQVYDEHVVDGPVRMQMKMWWQQASGKEHSEPAMLARTPAGWGALLGGAALHKIVLPRLDPITGEFSPPAK